MKRASVSPVWSTAAMAAVSAAVLVGFRVQQAATRQPSSLEQAYFDAAGNHIDDIPYLIAGYSARDVEVQEAVQRLLDPRRLLQRRYIDAANGRSFELLIVHCGDARDMLGHYPPVCYPAHGWESRGVNDRTITIGGGPAEAAEYGFEIADPDGGGERVRILGFFVIPVDGGRFTASHRDVLRSAGRSGSSRRGAAQVQIITPEAFPDDERERVYRETIAAIEPALTFIAEGISPPGAGPSDGPAGGPAEDPT